MIKALAGIILLGMAAGSLSAETRQCAGSNVRVTGADPALLDKTCDAVATAEKLFSQCKMLALSDRVEIALVDSVQPGCVAQYHRGDACIEVLLPETMQSLRLQEKEESVLSFLPISEYFSSVIVHELAHASYDQIPCPETSCLATHEYLAYAMQIMSLPPSSRAVFEQRALLDRFISIDELDAMNLVLGPNLFIQKVWTHFSAKEDPCAFIGQISRGEIVLDRSMP